MLGTANIFILAFLTLSHLCYNNIIIMPPGNHKFSFFLSNAKWFARLLISFNLTTSWWGSSVLVYKRDQKDSLRSHKECRKQWRHKLRKPNSLKLRKRWGKTHQPTWGHEENESGCRGSGTSVPQALWEEINSWEKDRSLTQIKLQWATFDSVTP